MLYPVIHIIIYPINYISLAAIMPAPPPPMMEKYNEDSSKEESEDESK